MRVQVATTFSACSRCRGPRRSVCLQGLRIYFTLLQIVFVDQDFAIYFPSYIRILVKQNSLARKMVERNGPSEDKPYTCQGLAIQKLMGTSSNRKR